jgi:signal transduction histidine kinase
VRYDDDLRVAVRTAVGPHGPVTVLAAADRESAERTLAAVGLALVVLWPLIVAAAAASTYALVGRSLRTVESIRARVAAIGSADLSRRVPVPPARDEIARLAETMNAMLARLEAGHAAQRRFVGDASHELRSPLATITAALELARDRPEMLDRELVSATLLPEAERMRRLVADLLTLAGADEHGLTLHAEEVDLDHVAEIEARAARLRRAGTPLDDLDADLRPARVIGDRAKLARVVANLLDNAATYARSRVGLATDMIGLDAVVTVLDDGPGIPAADRDRVLERFVRLDPDRARATGGAGLGLAIVAEIVAAHGGRVQIGEATGGGTRVTVRLPAQPPSR